MPSKICIIGHFGEGKNLLNGQTVKTKNITEELQKQLGQEQVLKIDTHGGLKNIIKAPFQVLYALKNSQNVMIFPAHNGLRIYAPLLSFFRLFFKGRKLHYNVIGGWLAEFISNKKFLCAALKKFDSICVETNAMKHALERRGFCKNVYVTPNCKNLTAVSQDELAYNAHTPYKLCTFSRVMKEKGIEDAVNAVTISNESLGYTAFSLDIYGQIDSDQTEWFNDLQKKFPAYISYKGMVQFDKSVETLKNYFALLFPTYYAGEGFAGTLIDAFSSGVPVISSDWKYNTEIVNDKVGYIYKAKDQKALAELLNEVANNPSMIEEKKKACLIESEKYRIDRVVGILVDLL